MNQEKQSADPVTYPQVGNEGEISLIDIYLIIKRRRKLFFSVIIFSFLLSLLFSYYKNKFQTQPMLSFVPKNEHVLILEIGRVFGDNAGYAYIDEPNNILEKINKIYIPNTKSSNVLVEHIAKTDLIVIKIKETENKINYNKMLLSIANEVIRDHNSNLTINNKNSYKPTKIIQKPIKKIISSETKAKSNYLFLIPILGTVIGVLLGFFVVFLKEFIIKVKEVEKLRK